MPTLLTSGKALKTNGALYDVNVGFNRGHGTFLWSQLGILDQMAIARLVKESPLPTGFDIFPSFSAHIAEGRGSIGGRPGQLIARRIARELANCDAQAREGFNEYMLLAVGITKLPRL